MKSKYTLFKLINGWVLSSDYAERYYKTLDEVFEAIKEIEVID